MLKKDKNATASQLPNGSQNNESNQNEYSDDRDGLEISDERRIDYFFIDNIFVEEEFDVYTMAYYMRIVRRAHNSHKGFIEFQATTCKALNISKSKIIRCNALLEFCNIIKIQHRRNPDNPNILWSSKITLVDKSRWNLKHGFRDAEDFAKSKRVPMAEEKKLKILELKKKNKEQKINSREVPRTIPSGTTYHTVRYHVPSIKNNPLKNNPIKNGGEENLENQNETPPPKEKNKSFKKSYKKGLSEIELNKKQIISYARDSHQKGVISKLFQFYEYDLFDNVLSPFIEKYPFELIKKFYIYSIETNRPIDVRITEEAFLKWQNLGTPEVPLAEAENFEVPAATAKPEVPLAEAENFEVPAATETDLFNELCDEVKTYLNSLPKHQLKLQKMDLQKIGIQKYEEYILPLIARIKRKNKYNKSNNIQENFNKYTSMGG